MTLVSRWGMTLWMFCCLAASLLLVACGSQAGRGIAPPTTATAPPSGAPPTQAPPPSGTGAETPPAPSVTSPGPTAGAAVAEPAPACTVGGPATASQTEGPYYKPNPPERASLLEPGIAGTRLIVAGHVLSADCQPIAGARVDFWQADDRGQYDNAGYRLRGYQSTDEAGRYSVETVVPGLYPGRTRHIHVKVQAPNQPVLTTQLYFPGEAANQTDRIFDPRLVLRVQEAPDAWVATFDFILPVR